MSETDSTVIRVRLPAPIHRAIKAAAAKQGLTLQDFYRLLAEERIRKREDHADAAE